MVDDKKNQENDHLGLWGSFFKFFDRVAAIRSFFEKTAEKLWDRIEAMIRQTEYLFVVYLWISVGVVLSVIGLFDLLEEWLKVPRGVVYLMGGLGISLVSMILLQTAKIKKMKRRKGL